MRFFIIIFLFISSFSFSAENIELSKAPVDLTDKTNDFVAMDQSLSQPSSCELDSKEDWI